MSFRTDLREDTTGFRSTLVFRHQVRPGVLGPLDGFPIDAISGLTGIVPESAIVFSDTFANYQGPTAEGSAGNYTLSGTVGTATVAQQAEPYGVIRLSTSAVADDNAVLQYTGLTINYATTGTIWCAARFSVSDADDMEVYFGLTETNADFVAALPAHGLFFEKAETATDFDFHVRNDGTSTENALDFGLTLADDTDVILAIKVERGQIQPYAWTAATGWKVGTGVASSDANVPDTTDDMTLHIALETGAAVAASADIDWIAVGTSRTS